MQEKIEDRGNNQEEKYKVEAGKELLNEVEKLNINIREKVTKPFIMRGTYQDLANQLKVGWHIDFMDRLSYLLQDGKI